MATSFQKNVKGFILPDVTAHQAEVAIAFFNLQLHLGHPPNLENRLKFWIDPRNKGRDFAPKPITLWERTIIDPNENPNDPNNYTISFMANIRDANDKQGGTGTATIPLADLKNGTYGSQVPYMYAQLRFNTFPGDSNLDGRVDLEDLSHIGQDWMQADVNSVADISGLNGIPDKNVDYWDLSLFTRDYLKDSNDPNTW